MECGQASFRSKEAAAGDWVLLLRTLWKFIQKYIHLHSTPPEERTNHLSHTFQPKPWTYPYSCHIRNKLTAPSRGEQAKGPVVCCSRGPIKPCSGKKKKKKRNIYIYISYWPLTHMGTQGQNYRVTIYQHVTCLPGGSAAKNLRANARDVDSIPGLGRLPGGGNDHPLQYSCLGNPTDVGAWQARVHEIAKESDTT